MRHFLFLLLVLLFVSPARAADTRSFDGVDDSQTISNPDVGSAGWTTCFWFFDDSFTDEQVIVGYATGAAQGWMLREKAAGDVRLVVFNPLSEFDEFTIGENAWHHVCVQKAASGFGVKFFLDGTETETASLEADPPLSTDEFIVAGPIPSDPGGNGFGSFAISHLGYWNVELSAPEIASLADKSECPTDVQSSNLKIFITEIDDDTTDTSSSAFTVVEAGSPGNITADTGLPCVGGPPVISAITGRNRFNAGWN